jgi:hypothetical protein
MKQKLWKSMHGGYVVTVMMRSNGHRQVKQ